MPRSNEVHGLPAYLIQGVTNSGDFSCIVHVLVKGESVEGEIETLFGHDFTGEDRIFDDADDAIADEWNDLLDAMMSIPDLRACMEADAASR